MSRLSGGTALAGGTNTGLNGLALTCAPYKAVDAVVVNCTLVAHPAARLAPLRCSLPSVWEEGGSGVMQRDENAPDWSTPSPLASISCGGRQEGCHF